MEKSLQPNNVLLQKLPRICASDYVNALVLNESGQALVFEEMGHEGTRIHWHMLNHCLTAHTDPLTAVQQALLQTTGYETGIWSYLGSHMMAADHPVGINYFFCAQQARRATTTQHNGPSATTIKWVSLQDLRYALLDGRIAMMNHALTVSLAMLTILR